MAIIKIRVNKKSHVKFSSQRSDPKTWPSASLILAIPGLTLLDCKRSDIQESTRVQSTSLKLVA